MEADDLNERKLNPFVFPSETNVRFTFLILAALMLACSVSAMLNLYTGLVETLSNSLPDIDFHNTATIEQWLVESNQRLMPAVTMGLLTGGLILMILLVALIIYLTHPYRIRRKKGYD